MTVTACSLPLVFPLTSLVYLNTMAASRPSNVSSFYDTQEPRGSFDPSYAIPHQQPSTGHRPRMDSSISSAFNPNRLSQNSADVLTGDMGPPEHRGTAGSAGYNRTSFFAPGREAPVKGGTDEQLPLHQDDLPPGGQDEGWDVYADFNNAGPRYSSAFVTNTTGYVHLLLLYQFFTYNTLQIPPNTCRGVKTRNPWI